MAVWTGEIRAASLQVGSQASTASLSFKWESGALGALGYFWSKAGKENGFPCTMEG